MLGLVGKGDRSHWSRMESVAANDRIDANVLWRWVHQLSERFSGTAWIESAVEEIPAGATKDAKSSRKGFSGEFEMVFLGSLNGLS